MEQISEITVQDQGGTAARPPQPNRAIQPPQPNQAIQPPQPNRAIPPPNRAIQPPHPNRAIQDGVTSQQPLVNLEDEPLPSKKEEVKVGRSNAWNHFTKFTRNSEKWSRCKHCDYETKSNPKIQGTGPMLTHIRKSVCMPIEIDDEQSLLVQSTENDDGSVGIWIFDQAAIRKALFKMIVYDELPFKFVDGKGFRQFMEISQPKFQMPSRWTVSRDVFDSYVEQKAILKTTFRNSCDRVCLTTDTWTSIQRNNYMALTAHFIDKDWKLHKRIINFCPISSHKGEAIARVIERCLKDWGIERVLTITVDNASSNDVAISHLKRKFSSKNSTISNSKYLHMRCVAHIINLIVVDGVRELGLSVARIRAAVRYVRNSPARLTKFAECIEMEGITCRLKLALDVSTRWNSTYTMLETAQNFEKAFDNFEEVDSFYKSELDAEVGVPTCDDWVNARKLVTFLSRFYVLTLSVSGSLYVTSNTYLREVSAISVILKDMRESDDPQLRRMSISMKAKYDKYWADIAGHNMLTYVAVILDPRRKLDYVKFCLSLVYDEEATLENYEKVKEVFDGIFEEYKCLKEGHVFDNRKRKTSAGSSSASASSASAQASESNSDAFIDNMFKRHQLDSGCWDNKTEVEQYFSEGTVTNDPNFDILLWWKANCFRFPILSTMARDVLAIPISTVSSESAFSTGGRVLDSYRSSLAPKMVQSLLCLQSWLNAQPVNDVEEELDVVEVVQEELQGRLLESIDL